MVSGGGRLMHLEFHHLSSSGKQVGIINIVSAICCTFMLQGDPSMKRRVSTQEGMRPDWTRCEDGKKRSRLSEEEVQAASKLQAILRLG